MQQTVVSENLLSNSFSSIILSPILALFTYAFYFVSLSSLYFVLTFQINCVKYALAIKQNSKRRLTLK